MKCSGENEIQHELLHDTAQTLESHELIRVVSLSTSYSFSVSLLHFIFFKQCRVQSNDTHGKRHSYSYFDYAVRDSFQKRKIKRQQYKYSQDI